MSHSTLPTDELTSDIVSEWTTSMRTRRSPQSLAKNKTNKKTTKLSLLDDDAEDKAD